MKRETSVSHGAAALPAERRVLARRGWAGGKSGLFEPPAHYAATFFVAHRSNTQRYPPTPYPLPLLLVDLARELRSALECLAEWDE